MKSFALCILAAVAKAQTATTYNGSIKYFIADLAPSFPCHPSYQENMTYFNMATDESNWNTIATILTGLQQIGFNGVRLPMFPESSGVYG